MISAAQRNQWKKDGFFIIRQFAAQAVGDAMLDRAVAISRTAANPKTAASIEHSLVMPEQNLAASAGTNADAELCVSKIFRLHRDSVFQAFIESPELLSIGRDLLGPQLDCFLSQFIFKNPDAWGQPWHQDAFYFPFDTSPQVGLWLAVTEATLANGCLWVLPGSHREPVHEHLPDPRPNANVGYVEIMDFDFSAAQPVTMTPGDLLVFHSHLMHRSKDNTSDGVRAAMVFHLAEHGTIDLSAKPSIVNDWMRLPDAPGQT